MASQKAWYWLAAGVLVLGINGEYQSGRMQWAHRYVDHSMALVSDYARCAGHYLAQFQMLLAQNPAGIAAPQNRVEAADVSSRDVQEELIREQLAHLVTQQLARQQAAAIARQAVLESDPGVVLCPHSQRMSVMVPQIRVPQINIPEVNIPQMRVEVPQVKVEVPRVRVDVPRVHLAPQADDDGML